MPVDERAPGGAELVSQERGLRARRAAAARVPALGVQADEPPRPEGERRVAARVARGGTEVAEVARRPGGAVRSARLVLVVARNGMDHRLEPAPGGVERLHVGVVPAALVLVVSESEDGVDRLGQDQVAGRPGLACRRRALAVVELRGRRVTRDVARCSDERIGHPRRVRMHRPAAGARRGRHHGDRSERRRADTVPEPHPVSPESAPKSLSGCTGGTGTRQAERQRRPTANAEREAGAAAAAAAIWGRPASSSGV